MKNYPVVCFGEILWDRLPSGDQPGGAPMNVAYHLNRLGVPAALISRIGQDRWGDELLQLLKKRDVSTEFIQVDPVHHTGLVVATVHPNKDVTYDIQQPVAWDFIEFQDHLAALLQKASFFVYGSLVARNTHARKTLYHLLDYRVQKVCDINLRAPHFSKGVLEHLLKKADILKLNENELPEVSSWYGPAKTRTDQMQLLQDKLRIKTIVVTCGSAGALLNLDGKIYSHNGFAVQVQDTVGSGDAFLAAYLFKTLSGAAPEERLQFANRLGAFVAARAGACPGYEPGEVELVQ